MTVCKHERTQGTLNGYSADKLTHRETIMVAQQPELTRVVGARVLMHNKPIRPGNDTIFVDCVK